MGLKRTLILYLGIFASLTSATQPGRNKGPIIGFAIVVTESWAIGAGFNSTWKYGDEINAGLYGISGVGTLVLPLLFVGDSISYVESANPALSVPYGVGLLGLSTYNFIYGDIHSDKVKFWTNFFGFNCVALISIVSGIYFR